MPQVIAEGAVKDDTDELIVKIEAKVDDDVISPSLSLPLPPPYHSSPPTLTSTLLLF